MKKKPYEYKKRRGTHLGDALSCSCNSILATLLPNVDTKLRRTFFAETAPTFLGVKDVDTAIKIGNNIGLICGQKKKEGMLPSTWQPLMAVAAEITSRERMESLVDGKISQGEWSNARKHAIFPGAGEAILKKKKTKKQIPEDQLDHFLAWISRSGLTQDLAFGHKIFKYQNGLHVPIASVKKQTQTHTLQDCIMKSLSELKYQMIKIG